VRIVVALDEKLKFIDLARRICHTGHVPYEWFHMSSRYLDGAIILYIRRNGGFIAPNKPVGGREQYDQEEEDGEEGFSGAFVKEPMPGRYDWVYDLDLTSMYPKIIISLNISPETKAGKCYRVEYKPDAIIRKRKEIIRENNKMDQYTNEMCEPTPEQEHTNNIESQGISPDSEGINRADDKPPCEVCDQPSIGLFNLHGQQLKNNLPNSEIFFSDSYLCKECFCEKYPNDHKTKLWSK